jgi:hypothetical protein
VHIKGILRDANQLKIIKNKEFNIKVLDSKRKEILNTKLKTNDF